MGRKGILIIAMLLAGTAAFPAHALGQAAPPAARTSTVPPLAFTTRTLRNGLVVYAIRDTSTANVSVQMWYNVGSKDDPAGRSGFAHLFEHILSRVTRNIPPGELSRIVEEQAGGTRNASTGPDTTNYYETVPANQLEAMLWAHAERMGRSVLDQQVFEAERSIVKEEMRQRVLSQPYGRLQRYYTFDTGFTAHPYRRSGIGTMADLDAATLEDARAFHANFYRPDNAVLIVSGNFDQAGLDRLIDRHLGALPRPRQPILRHRATERPRTEARTMTVYGPNVPLPAIMFTWQRPRQNHPDSAALTMLDQILSGGQSSRLFRSLVYDRQLAQAANSQDFGLEDAGIFAVQAIVAGGRDVAETEAQLAAEIARVRDQPVSAAELEEARNELVSQLLFQRETPEGRAFELGNAVTTANDPRWGDRLLAAVQRVTAADVQRVARRYLTDSTRVSIRYLDQAQRTGEAAPDPSAQPTDPTLGRTFPPATAAPNQLAPEGERMAVPAAGPRQPFNAPAFAERRLANGMRVVIARSTSVPIASALLVFGGGTSADPAARPGVASMMAGLIDNGAAGMTAPQLAARAESLGARIGGSAGNDSSFAFVAAPTANIEAAGALLAQIVREPAFAQEELDRERRRALDQLRVNMRDPSFVNQRVAFRAVYGDAPYGAPPGGTPASLAALTRDELTAYHRAWWRPDNATLVITGALDAEAGFALAERLFGQWAAPAEPMPQMPANRAGAARTPRVIVVDNPDSDQSAVSVVMRGIARGDSDYFPLVVANSALGGSSTARLFQEVRVRRALSYGANSSLPAYRDEGLLFALAQTRNNAAPEVAQVMLGEIRRMAQEPLTDEVLQKRRTLLVGSFGRQVETTNGLGQFLSTLAVQGVPMSEYARYIPNLEAVTPGQVAASVAAEIDPAQASIVIVGRASEFLEALRAQYPNVEVIPIGELDFGSATLRGGVAGAVAAQ
ncbi:MAG TPA: pitrilysin family protein [Allosphingosinicella sp.]|nr:pitrilysin family protein [Allosphingosinicella sp.]